MGADRSDFEAHPSRDEDERDESEIRARPYPPRSEPDFPNPDEDGFLASAVSQRVSVVTRPLPAEGVPNCSIRIGTKIATTNQSGNANVDLSDLADGEYEATFLAPDTSDAEMGPNFPPDPSKLRVWRSLNGRVDVQRGQIIAANPADILVVTGNALRVRLQPAWLRAPLAGNRPGAVDRLLSITLRAICKAT